MCKKISLSELDLFFPILWNIGILELLTAGPQLLSCYITFNIAIVTFQLIFSVQAESSSSPAVNGNYMASVNPADNSCLLEKYQDKHKDNAFGLLSNLYASEGKPGKVKYLIAYTVQ